MLYRCVARIVALLAVIALGSFAQAQTTYYWDTTAGTMTGGSGTWSTTASYWSTTTGGAPSLSVWTPGNNAEFTTGAGAVALDPSNPVSVANIAFDTNTAYTLSGGTLNLSGGTINTNGTATISSYISSPSGLTQAGTGVLTLSNLTLGNSGIGTLNVNAGELSVTTFNPPTSGTGTVNLNGGVFNVANDNFVIPVGATANAYFNGGSAVVGTNNGWKARYGTINNYVSASGGTITGVVDSNYGGTMNFIFSGGGALAVNGGLTDYGADTWSFSGNGALTATGVISFPSGSSFTDNMSGGTIQTASYFNTAGTTSVTLGSGGLLSTTGTAGSNGINISGGAFTANFNGGTISTSGGNGLYVYGGAMNLNVGALGGTLIGALSTNFNVPINVGLTGGGVLNVNGHSERLGRQHCLFRHRQRYAEYKYRRHHLPSGRRRHGQRRRRPRLHV
jgi:hypothetical protein